MADLVTRMRVDSSEYDQKIKRAAENLSIYADQCRKVGGTLEVVEKETLEYVKSLGQMETVSRSAAGKLAELKKAYTDMSVQYKQLTDEEKQSPFGRALSSQLDQLKTRINDAKTNLAEVSKELGGSGGGGLGGALDSIAGKFGMSIKSLVGWGTAIAAAKGALEVAKDAFFASEANIDEWGRTVESSQALYEGFLTALNTGDISGYLARMNQISNAAVDAYNALDMLGTQKAIQTPELSAKQTEIARYRNMIQTGRYIAPADGSASPEGLKSGDTLSKEQIQEYTKKLEEALGEVADITKSQVQSATKAIDKLYAEQAAILGVSKKEFMDATSTWTKFTESMEKASKYNEWKKDNTTYVQMSTSAGVITQSLYNDKQNPYRDYAWLNTFKDDGERFKRLIDEIQKRDAAQQGLYNQYGQIYRRVNRVENYKPFGGTGDGSTTKTQTELQQNEAAISKLTEEYQQLATAAKTADEAQRAGITERHNAIRQEIGTLQERNNELKRFAQEAKGISVNIGVNSSLPELTAHLQELQKAQSLALNAQEWQAYQQQIEQTNTQIDALKGKWKEGTEATFTARVNTEQLEQLKASLPQDTTITVGAKTGNVELPDIPREITQIINTKIGEEVTPNIAEEVVQTIRTRLGNIVTPEIERDLTQTINTRIGSIVTPEIERDLTQTINTRIGSIVTPEIADELTQVVNVKPGNVVLPDIPKEITQVINTKVGQKITPDIAEEVVQTISTRLGRIVTPEIERDLTQIINTRIGSIVTPEIADELTQVVNVKPGDVQLPEVPTEEDITIKADTAQAYADVQKLVAGIEGMTVTFNVKPQMQQGINIQNSAGLSQYISGLKKDLETANFGSDLYNSISAQLSDTSMLQSLVSESLKAGLGTALFDVADETGKDFWTRAMEGGVEDVDWQSIADKINERRKAMKLDQIELDFKEGKTKSAKKEQTPLDETKQIVSGLSTVASGLQSMGIELPKGVQSVLSGIQGLMSVINGVTSIIQVFSTTSATAQTVSINGNTAAVSALTAAVIANTAAVGAQTLTSSMGGGFLGWMLGFSNGGVIGKAANGMVIPGNSFSGDKLRMPVLDGGGFIGVNSGEVILNRAQAGVIASDLQGIGQQQGVGGGTPYTTGENIVLGINNWGRRTGRGELVFSRG